MDYLHKILKWIDYNRYKVLALVVVAGIMVYGIGCDSMTASPVKPDRKVTRPQFEAEALQVWTELQAEAIEIQAMLDKHNAKVEAHNQAIDAGRDDLDRQDQIKAKLFELGSSIVTGWASGGVPTASLVGTGITALGVLFGTGAVLDSKRKDKVITESKKAKKKDS